MTEAPEMPVHLRRNRFDPVVELTHMRERSALTRLALPSGTEFWLATRYDVIRQVLGNATRFSNRGVGIQVPLQGSASEGAASGGRMTSGFLPGYDPPDHTRLRKLLTAEFTTARMLRLRPRVAEIVSRQLDAMADAGSPADLVDDFALPVPLLVICELLGVPYADRAEFQKLSKARLDMTRDLSDRVAASDAARSYMADLMARQRKHRGDGMLGRLVGEHGDEIGESELAGVADLLLLAGHESTSNMLSLGTLLLLREPEQLAVLRDPARVDNAIEELLRYLSVVHTLVPRRATQDVALDGIEIRAGELVVCSIPAANRDPALGDDLDRVDLTRTAATHLAFGHGIHHCLGAPLARMEMRIAYPALFDRFPGLRLNVAFDEVQFRVFSVVYGLSSLPVAW
jgi:cytochrome P450